jgi:hypothetical protein
VTLKSYTFSMLFGYAVTAIVEVLIAFLLLIAIGEAVIHCPEIRHWLVSERAREISQPVETVEKSAKL